MCSPECPDPNLGFWSMPCEADSRAATSNLETTCGPDRETVAASAQIDVVHTLVGRTRIPLLRAVLFSVAVLLLSACSTSDPEAIATNEGGVLVRPPDVLDGEPIDPADAAGRLADSDQADGPAPVEFAWFDGEPGSTSDFAGTPTVVNFWASTCAACIAEMPEFESVSQSLAGQVNFVGVNVADIRSQADKLAEETGVTYRLAADPDSAVFRSYGGFVMPTTVLLDANGVPAYTWAGILNESELRILINDHIAPGTNDV